LGKDDYDENDLYVFGIDPEIVSGAEGWDEGRLACGHGTACSMKKRSCRSRCSPRTARSWQKPAEPEDEEGEDETHGRRRGRGGGRGRR